MHCWIKRDYNSQNPFIKQARERTYAQVLKERSRIVSTTCIPRGKTQIPEILQKHQQLNINGNRSNQRNIESPSNESNIRRKTNI